MKVLIADDDRTIHASFTKPLENEGYDVLNAYDGAETLKIVAEHSPDIILLDLTMPEMDGRTICQQLKSAPENKHIKIIMLTAKDNQHDRNLGFELGADEYITKPCSTFYLLRAIKKIMEGY